MKVKDLMTVGLRLLGVYVVVTIVQTISMNYQSYTSWSTYPGVNLSALKAVLSLQVLALSVLAICLLKFPAFFASVLIGKALSAENQNIPTNQEYFLETGFCLLGIYILSWAIPDLIYNALEITLLTTDDSSSYLRENILYAVITEITTVVEVAIGLYLSLQAKGLRRLLWRFRGFKNDSL